MHMRCPDGIGREIWEWVGRISGSWLEKKVPPIEWGRKPSPRCDPLRDETEWPLVEVVVGVYCFLIIIIVVHGRCVPPYFF